MEAQDNITITMGTGYKTSVGSKQNYYNAIGQLDYIAVLDDLAGEYRQMKDDELIQELKFQNSLFKQSLDRYFASVNAGEVYDRMRDFQEIQIKRQNLTNAYALNHGAGLVCIKQISTLDDNILNTIQALSLFYWAYQDLFNKHLSGKQKTEMQSLVSDFFLRESYLRHLNKNDRSYLKEYFIKYGTYDISGRSVVDNIINDTAIGAVEFTINHIYEDEKFKKLCDYFDLIRGKLNDMIKCGQFPPYGVALAIDFEDDGQRVLPWSGNLSESQIIEIRKMIHELGGDKPADICRAILAAYCRLYFNDEPSYKQVMQEFYPVYIDPGFYCREVSNKIKGTRPNKLQNLKKNTIKRFNPGLKIWVDCRNEQMIKDAIRCEKLKLFYDRLESGISQF